MPLLKALRVLLPGLVVACLVAINCTESNPIVPDSGWNPNEEQVAPACDPDMMAPCPDDWFICTEDGQGGKHCEGQQPAVPDDGDWDCHEMGTTLICEGDHVPDGGDWECETMDDGSVVCRRHAYIPSGGGEGRWDCYYEGEFRICDFRDDGGSPGGDGDGDTDSDSDGDGDTDSDSDADIGDDGGMECPPGVEIPTREVCDDNIDNDCDGDTDEDCGGGPDEPPPCVCIPGAWRYCDTPDYCLWGTQYCEDDGMHWTACLEVTTIPSVCESIDGWYSPAAAACCVNEGFCCQDMWDLNHNGDTWESLGECTDIICVPEEEAVDSSGSGSGSG